MKVLYAIFIYTGYRISTKMVKSFVKKAPYKGIFIRNAKMTLYKSNKYDTLSCFKDYDVKDFKEVYYEMKRSNVVIPLIKESYVNYTYIDREMYILNLLMIRYIFATEKDAEFFIKLNIIRVILLYTFVYFVWYLYSSIASK